MKTIILLSLLLVLVVGIQAKSVETRISKSGKIFYKSANAAYFEAAKKDCIERLQGTLAKIESEDDLNGIEEAVEGEPISQLWIGAKLDQRTSACRDGTPFNPTCWKWDSSKIAVNSNFLEWNEDAKSRNQNSLDRLVLEVGYASLKVVPNTETNRYICEVKRASPENPPNPPSDPVEPPACGCGTRLCKC